MANLADFCDQFSALFLVSAWQRWSREVSFILTLPDCTSENILLVRLVDASDR